MVPGFTLVHELGAGRFATSWLGEDEDGGSAVVKLLRYYAPDPNTVQRFLAEAQRLARSPDLQHPSIARLQTAGVHLVSALFLVYESGGEITLADELRARGRIPAARALELCAQLADGLGSLHKAGVLHLDLKPANVALTRLADGTEQAVLLDVVTAHLLAKAGLRETATLPLSTAAYLAPEEETLDARADLYSLGVLLYQLLSGRLPVMGATAAELRKAHREHGALRLRDAGRKVHPELEALLARMMARSPDQRFSSGEELAVVMRAMVPIADAPPPEGSGEAEVEDPVPVLAPLPPDEPLELLGLEDAPPELDPALERALLGDVPPQAPDPPPGVPAWVKHARPRWVMPAAIGVAALVMALAAVFALRPSRRARRMKAQVVAATPAASAPEASEARGAGEGSGPAGLAHAPEAPAVTAPGAPLASAETPGTGAPPTAPAPVKPPRTRVASSDPLRPPADAPPTQGPLTRAQQQLSSGQAAQALQTLQTLLADPSLGSHDRARATRLMGDAEAKRGNKAAAIDWYRKFLKLTDAPKERPRVVKLIQALSR